MLFPDWLTHARFNFAEGCFWLIMAIVVPLRFSTELNGRQKLAAVFSFVGFGISDFVEITTGVWWRPWWLLALKAICLLTIALVMWRLLDSHRRTRGKNS